MCVHDGLTSDVRAGDEVQYGRKQIHQFHRLKNVATAIRAIGMRYDKRNARALVEEGLATPYTFLSQECP